MHNPFKNNFDENLINETLHKYYFRDFNVRVGKDSVQANYLIKSSIAFYKNYLDCFYKTFYLSKEKLIEIK